MSTPIDSKSIIIPDNSSFMSWIIDIITLVEELGIVLEREESVSKATRNEEHLLIPFREQETFPSSKSWWILPEVHYHIIHASSSDTNELGLGFTSLKMKPSKDSLLGFGVVILDKSSSNPNFLKFWDRICFHKKSASISEYLRFDEEAVLERCGNFGEHRLGY